MNRTHAAARPTALHAALAGAVGGAVALAAGELATALVGSGPSLVTAVGGVAIDELAGSLKEIVVEIFGTNDKPALIVSLVAGAIATCAALGVLARRRPLAGPAGIVAVALVGAIALAVDGRGGTGVALVAGCAAAAAGLAAYALLWRLGSAPLTTAAPAPVTRPAQDPRSPGVDRRRVLLAGAGLAVGAAVLGGAAGRIRESRSVATARRALRLPRPRRATAVPADADLGLPGLTSYVTPNDRFYRIDTALLTPQVDPDGWRLAIRGLVERPLELSYGDLLAMDAVEAPVTLQCVSNEVGDDLVGTAVWQGVPLADLLALAGPTATAAQVVGRSVDGFTAGFPLAAALDGRTALVAYAMNGEPLPAAHGFPARLVVAGLYGYVSATKWLAALELATWEGVDGYWIPRGWSKEGPIKTASRIDVPAGRVAAGRQAIAGVAWAPGRGIARVEVQVDDGPWQPAELAPVASDETWRQWRLPWDAAPGEHLLRVRATDGDGSLQEETPHAPAPDGATGWHARRVEVA